MYLYLCIMSQYGPYIDIYVRVSFGGQNLGASCTRKLIFGMLLVKT